MHIWRKIAKYAVVTLFWVGLWWIASLLVGKEVLLPSPLVTVAKAAVSCRRQQLLD